LIEILLVNDLGPEKLELVTTIQHSFNELHELLNDILDLAKLESHRLMPLSVRFDPTEVIASLPEAYLARKLGPVLHVLADPEEPLLYCGCPHCLRRIATALLSNCVKFTQSGRICIGTKAYGDG
jgi:signal transduction histidine kinase